MNEPTTDQVAQAERTLDEHKPEPEPEDPYRRACLACRDIWPCPRYRAAREIVNEAYAWIDRGVYALPDRFADRIPAGELAPVREYTNVGEWDEALELLLAILGKRQVPITDDERTDLAKLADAMDLPRTWGVL